MQDEIIEEYISTPDFTLHPSLISAIKTIEDILKRAGLNNEDILHLIHKRCKGHVPKTQLRIAVKAIKQLEKDIIKQRS